MSFLMMRRPPRPPLFPYTTLFRSGLTDDARAADEKRNSAGRPRPGRSQHTPLAGAEECKQDRGARERRVLRSEEHTSELQSRPHLVCRLLLEKKNEIGDWSTALVH